MTDMTRDEHLAWCKQRALEYLDRGELENAVASMASDLGKHPELKPNERLLMLGAMQAGQGDSEGRAALDHGVSMMFDVTSELEEHDALSQFLNRLRSLFCIDGYLLPELTDEQQREFVRDPVRYFISTDWDQQKAIWREIDKRQPDKWKA